MKLSDNVSFELKFPDDRTYAYPGRRKSDNEVEAGITVKF